eukprot:306141-Pelagomonas_calceolata.AAC.1
MATGSAPALAVAGAALLSAAAQMQEGYPMLVRGRVEHGLPYSDPSPSRGGSWAFYSNIFFTQPPLKVPPGPSKLRQYPLKLKQARAPSQPNASFQPTPKPDNYRGACFAIPSSVPPSPRSSNILNSEEQGWVIRKFGLNSTRIYV